MRVFRLGSLKLQRGGELRQAGNDTVFDNPTATFRDAARLLGVLQTFGLDATPDTTKSVENAV